MLHSGRLHPYPKTRLERLASEEHSSLLRKFVNYNRKKFYNIEPGTIVIKLSFFESVALTLKCSTCLKNLPGTKKTLWLIFELGMKKKRLIVLKTGPNVIKIWSVICEFLQ